MNRRMKLIIFSLLCCISMSQLAYADDRFIDVPISSPFFNSVTYLAKREITYGTGNSRYSPEENITMRQWSVMLCRTFYGAEMDAALDLPFGKRSLQTAIKAGWINECSINNADLPISRYDLLDSAFRAAGIPICDGILYWTTNRHTFEDGTVGTAIESPTYGKCADLSGLANRGETAVLLYSLLTKKAEISPSPFTSAIAANGQMIEKDHLIELSKIPEQIFQDFVNDGWVFSVDPDYLARRSAERGTNVTGVTSTGKKTIVVSPASAILHEFGHYLDHKLNQAELHEALFQEEALRSQEILRKYSLTNRKEFFADCFAYWIWNRNDTAKMQVMKETIPKTYAYFCALEVNGWNPNSFVSG